MIIASALAGIIAIGFAYAVGTRVFAGPRLGALTAGILALTPLLWRQAQSAPASLFPLPFVMGWLWAVAHVEDARSPRWAAAAGVCLGVGVYSTHAAAV